MHLCLAVIIWFFCRKAVDAGCTQAANTINTENMRFVSLKLHAISEMRTKRKEGINRSRTKEGVRPAGYYCTKFGRKRVKAGKAIRIIVAIIIATRKRVVPLNIVSSGKPLVIPFMTYTFMPTGGVIVPTPVKIVMMTPNQMGSYPRDTTRG